MSAHFLFVFLLAIYRPVWLLPRVNGCHFFCQLFSYRMILKSFSWLSVHELIQAAEATVLPVREGVAKPQARSTGSSVSNGLPNPNGGFRGVRWSNVNPGLLPVL